MPTLGQNFHFGFYDLSAKTRMRAIKAAGFDDVMIWLGNGYTEWEGTPKYIFDTAVKCGLRVRTAHFPTDETPALWREGEAGDSYECRLIDSLRLCGDLGVENLVVHTTKKFLTPPPNEVGARRMTNAAQAAEKYGVNIALENTRFLHYNQFLYDQVPSKRMRFCFDSGHANCFTPDEDPLERFGNRMVTMHLHDNRGRVAGDEHMLPGYGHIDFIDLSARLAKLSPESYNLESSYSLFDAAQKLSMEAYLDRSISTLKLLTQGQLKRRLA